jgi:hypothetical protein
MSGSPIIHTNARVRARGSDYATPLRSEVPGMGQFDSGRTPSPVEDWTHGCPTRSSRCGGQAG